MKHEREYEIITTREGILIFAIKARKDNAKNPRIIYDGGKHATFYRKPDDVVLLDYLNPKIIKVLKESKFVIVTEIDYAEGKVVRDYKVKIVSVKKNPFVDIK